MPQRHKDAPPEEELYAPIEWSGAGEYERHPLREGRGDRQDHDRPARGPQRLPAADAGRAVATRSSWPARTPRSASIVLTGAGEEAFCSGGDQRVRGDTATSATTRSQPARALPRHRPAGADAPPAEAGGGDGRRLRGRRRPHPPPLLRPDDRRRQRPLRADRAAGRLLGRRLRRLACCATCRDQEGEGVLAALPPVRRRGGAARWAWSTRSCRSRSSSARRSPGAARCSPSPPSPCAWSRRASTPHEDGYAGIQQLAHDANLLFYGSEEASEGREAFKEKRQPDFSKFPRRP